MGGVIYSDRCSGYFSVLCKRLSGNYSGTVSDTWIWNHRFSG